MLPTGIHTLVLDAWERGAGLPVADRATLLLDLLPHSEEFARPETLAEQDAAMLALRMSLVGPRLDAVVRCPACQSEFDVPLDLTQLTPDARPGAPVPVARLGAPVSVAAAGYAATVRPPMASDVRAIPSELAPEPFAAALFCRCVEHASFAGQAVPPSMLPPGIRAAAAAALAAQGMEIAHAELGCGVCGHEWLAPVDIASALTGDIDAWAIRLLDEVHRLARAYHWREADILALSPPRRRFYLEAVGASPG